MTGLIATLAVAYGLIGFVVWGRTAGHIANELKIGSRIDVDEWCLALFIGLLAGVIWPVVGLCLGAIWTFRKLSRIPLPRHAWRAWTGTGS